MWLLLDLHRPGDPQGGNCDAVAVAEDIAALVRIGLGDQSIAITVGSDGPRAGFDPDVRGVGLGLFTADGLARTHGGRIIAGNREEGTGAVITVEMPLASGPEEQAGQTDVQAKATP